VDAASVTRPDRTVPSVKDRRWPVAAALAGLMVAAVGAAVVGTPATSLRGARAAAALETAWERSLRATYVLDATFSRTTPAGNRFESPIRVVRRPPDNLRTGLGTSEGVLNSHRVRCLAAVAGVAEGCFTATDTVDFDATVARELANLHSYLDGDRPLYVVVGFRGGCFSLALHLRYPSPPFGTAALFCFDGATGAMTGVVEQRDDATDRIQPGALRPSVTDADLQVPSDKGTVLSYGPDAVPGESVPTPPATTTPPGGAPATTVPTSSTTAPGATLPPSSPAAVPAG
jgi:hypothetical protein